MTETLVKKRSGSEEIFNPEKINKVIDWACDGIENVSASSIAINAKISIVNKMETTHLHDLLIESAANMISEEQPEYSKVAARLLNYKLRKEVWGGFNAPRLFDHIQMMVDNALYDEAILDTYTKDEINKINEFLHHDRDDIFEYAGLKQLCDKYIMKNVKDGRMFETPQFMYILIAMTLFGNYPQSKRMVYVKRAYSYFSRHKINLPTPIMAGIRSNKRSGASCCLIEVDDDLRSISTTAQAAMLATSDKYGMGIDMSKVRSIGASVRNGETKHTGVIPFLRVMEGSIKSCMQGAARRGSGTVTFTIFHPEILDILKLKDNSAVEEKRVAHLDYLICNSKLFWQRYLNDEYITLMDFHDAPEVYNNFGLDGFDEIYEKMEKRKFPSKKRVKASELFNTLIKQRQETGRIYILNIDHANKYSPWSGHVTMSNLCVEILQEISPIYNINDTDGEIGVCCLAATNMFTLASDQEHEKACDVIVRLLDELIDYQDYFAPSAKKFATEKRSLGVGVINYAAWLARQNLKYSDQQAPNVTSQFFEKQQYYLMKASVQLAKEKGPCKYSDDSMYTTGLLPDSHYKDDIDDFVTHKPSCDWEGLRKDLSLHGIRNATVSAIMPSEASSKISGATNGIEPPRSPIVYMKSKGSTLPCLIPNIKNKEKYTYAFDMGGNDGYIRCAAAIQRWICMGMSTNFYYRAADYPDRQIPREDIISDHLMAYKYGIKSHYYLNTDDGDVQFESGCAGGACSI